MTIALVRPDRWTTPAPSGVTARDVDEAWIPVRYLQHEHRCSFCGGRIAAGSPGHTTGTRGTRAWFNKLLHIYECLGCRSEGSRAEWARGGTSSSPERTD